MNVETFNYSPESLAPIFYLNQRDRKNIYIFSTEKESLEFYNNFSNFVPDSSTFLHGILCPMTHLHHL